MITGKLWIPRRRWHGFVGIRWLGLASEVELEDGRRFQVRYHGLRPRIEVIDDSRTRMAITGPLGSKTSFFDEKGEKIERLQLVAKWRTGYRLDLQAGDETVPLVLNLVNGRREFKAKEMQFWHRDFQSNIHFRAEDRLVFPAMIAAFYVFGGSPNQSG